MNLKVYFFFVLKVLTNTHYDTGKVNEKFVFDLLILFFSYKLIDAGFYGTSVFLVCTFH